MDSNEILNNLGANMNTFSFNLVSLLKIPFLVILVGNILFTLLLFLRVRILADTFKSPNNKKVKLLILFHITVVVIGSLLSLLFVILS